MQANYRFTSQGVPEIKLLCDDSENSVRAEGVMRDLGIQAEVSRNRGVSKHRPALVFRWGEIVEHHVGVGAINTALLTRFVITD